MSSGHYPSLEGRTVIVTGGASGIGAAFVRAFVANRCKVAFLDVDAAAGQALAAALAGDLQPLFLPCDLLDLGQLKRALAEARDRLGPAAVLVNNAANDQRQPFDSVTPDSFDWMMAVNFRHVFFAAQAVVPQMRELGFGSIVNMSSVVWMGGGRDLEVYAAAKAAIVGLTNSLARDLGPDRIRVNAIAPGMVLTDRQRRLWFQDKSRITDLLSRQCLPDLVTPEDVAGLALFLASDDSRSITKQCLSVNGGSR